MDSIVSLIVERMLGVLLQRSRCVKYLIFFDVFSVESLRLLLLT